MLTTPLAMCYNAPVMTPLDLIFPKDDDDGSPDVEMTPGSAVSGCLALAVTIGAVAFLMFLVAMAMR